MHSLHKQTAKQMICVIIRDINTHYRIDWGNIEPLGTLHSCK